MTHSVELGLSVSVAAALFYIILGTWVLTLTPRRTATILLGAFAVLFGLDFLLRDLAQILHLSRAVVLAGSFSAALSSLALVGLASTIPSVRRLKRPIGIAFAIGFLSPMIQVLPDVLDGDVSYLFATSSFLFIDMWFFWTVALLLPILASPTRGTNSGETRQLAILGVALALGWAFAAGSHVLQIAWETTRGGTGLLIASASIVGTWIAVAGLWGWNMLRAPPDAVRPHRAAMLTSLGVLLAGALVASKTASQWTLVDGIVRTLGVVLLAYGILRHDIAGLDAKVEWGVSKTTVAGVFIAVFFVAGELAETFFGDVFGPYIGVIAAGALVFVISPLQRLADSFAAKAVPGGAEVGADVEQRFRPFVELALADGEISREQERQLAERAEELGLTPTRAFHLREQIENEVYGGEAK